MLYYLLTILAVFGISFFFAVVLQVPKKYIIHAGVIGAIGRTVNVIIICSNNPNTYLGIFLASLVVTTLSHVCARKLKAPVTIFLIASLITLIPGYQFFLTVYNLVKMDMDQTFEYLIETIMISGAVAIAIFIVDSAFKFTFEYLAEKRC